jgi:hypothetical protein
MSVKSSAMYQQHLTTYAQGIGMEMIDPIANLLAPVVPVTSAMGKYKEFNDKNAFQVHQTARAIGGPAKRIEFSATDPDYNCTPNALEIGIDDHEREVAGADPFALESAKVKTLLQTASRSHAVGVYDYLAGQIAATSKTWNDAANPIQDLDAVILKIADDIGEFPSDIVLGLTAWDVFRNHAKVLSRFTNVRAESLTLMQAASLLITPGIRIHLSTLVKDSAPAGVAKSNARVVGSSIWVFKTLPGASIYDPSFAKTFRTNASGVDAVYKYRDDKCRSDIFAVDWSEQVKVTSTASVGRLAVSAG